MKLRGNNFVADIRALSVIKATIEGLIGDDKYYFLVSANGKVRVYYVYVLEDSDGMEFQLYKDLTNYTQSGLYNEDEFIKIMTNKKVATSNPLISSYSDDPAKAMSEYVEVYIDAIQTVE